MLNKVALVGRIVRDLELKRANNGKAYLQFTVACPLGGNGDHVDFIPCVAWGKQAENMAKYLGKGCRVCVDGSIATSTKELSDGTHRRYVQVRADRVKFLDFKEGLSIKTNEKENSSHESVAQGDSSQQKEMQNVTDFMSFDMEEPEIEDQNDALMEFMRQTNALIDDEMLPF